MKWSAADTASWTFRMSVYRYIVNGALRGADDIRTVINSPQGTQLKDDLTSDVLAQLKALLKGIAPDDNLTVATCSIDNRSLSDQPGTDANYPPVVVRADGTLRVLPATYGLPNTTDMGRLIPSALHDGIFLRRQVTLGAPAGHCLELNFETFPGSLFNETKSRNYLIYLNNTLGSADFKKGYTVSLFDPDSPEPWPESVKLTGKLDIPDLSTFLLDANIIFDKVDPDPYWQPGPGIYNITTISGYTLSELARAGIISTLDVFTSAIEPVKLQLEGALSRLFNCTFGLNCEWGFSTSLTCRLTGEARNVTLVNLDPELFFGILQAGGTFGLTLPLVTGVPTELKILPPSNMTLGRLQPDGMQGGRPAYSWKSPKGEAPLLLELGLAGATHPSADDVRINLTADFNTPEIDILRLLTSGKTDVPVFVELNVKVGTMKLPSVLQALLPANLTLDYISADLFRLLIHKKLISEVEMNLAANEMAAMLENPLRSAFGKNAKPHVRYINSSLSGYNVSRMDGSRPILIQAWASGEKTKAFDWFKLIKASSGIVSVSQDFRFNGIEGWNLTYNIRFSPQFTISRILERGVHATRGYNDGREYFWVNIGERGGNGNVTVIISPTTEYLLSKIIPPISPCIVFFVVLIILIIHRRIKGRRHRRPEQEMTNSTPKPVMGPPVGIKSQRHGNIPHNTHMSKAKYISNKPITRDKRNR